MRILSSAPEQNDLELPLFIETYLYTLTYMKGGETFLLV